MPSGIFASNNNTDANKPKDDSLKVLDEIISYFTDSSKGWFTVKASASNNNKKFAVILESAAIDPIIGQEQTLGIVDENGTAVSQKWRIFICGTIKNPTTSPYIEKCRVFWGSALQLPDNMISSNTVSYLPPNDVPFVTLWDDTTMPEPNLCYLNYALTIVPRGFALSVWRNFQNNAIRPTNLDGSYANTGNVLLCIQRPVLPGNGQIKTPPAEDMSKGKLPVFALSLEGNSTPGREGRLSIVRERDINASSPMRDISEPGLYTLYGVNLNWTHPNILSNNTHVIKVPFGLCTDRHIYPEEMDLIAFTQATSFIGFQEAKISMYGADRYYTGTWGSVTYNYADNEGRKKILGGARICLLSNGPDF